jgi:hypothetical protein
MTERREAGRIVTRVHAVAPLEIRNEFAVVHLTKPAHLPEPDRIQPMPLIASSFGGSMRAARDRSQTSSTRR